MASKIISSPEDLAVLQAYAAAKSAVAKAEAAEAEAKALVVALLGEADTLKVDGVPVVTYREVSAQRFDVKGFHAADPETYGKWLVEAVSRRFLWKGLPA